MSLFITRRPEKLLSGTTYSRWTALHNPYLFEFTRKDYAVTSTAIRPAYHATLPTVQVTGDLTGLLSAGETIYLNSGVYNGAYEVEAVYPVDATHSYVVINTSYTSVGGSGYINLPILVNYKLYIIIYNAVTDAVIDVLYPKPDSTGLVIADMAGAIKSVLETEDTCSFINYNEKNDKLSGSFYIGYGVTYKFGETQITTTEVVDAYTYYWISAARQVTGKTVLGIGGAGQNMKEYVPYNQSGSAAKFLTMFDRPTQFEGYPFTIGFIYSEDFASVYLERHQQNKNINSQATSSESSQVLYNSEHGYMNDLLPADADATTTQYDIWLETGAAYEDGYVVSGGIQLGSASAHALPYSSGG